MVEITYANLRTLINDTSLNETICEAIIDHAVNKINGYGADVPNMTGTAGSKTLTVESAVAGFVLSVAVLIYQRDYKSSGAQSSSFTLGAISTAESSSTAGGSEIEGLAKAAAEKLRDYDITYG